MRREMHDCVCMCTLGHGPCRHARMRLKRHCHCEVVEAENCTRSDAVSVTDVAFSRRVYCGRIGQPLSRLPFFNGNSSPGAWASQLPGAWASQLPGAWASQLPDDHQNRGPMLLEGTVLGPNGVGLLRCTTKASVERHVRLHRSGWHGAWQFLPDGCLELAFNWRGSHNANCT